MFVMKHTEFQHILINVQQIYKTDLFDDSNHNMMGLLTESFLPGVYAGFIVKVDSTTNTTTTNTNTGLDRFNS